MTSNTPTTTRDGVIGQSGSEVVTVDQATGAEFARYPVAGKEEAATAVAAARSVSGPWWDLGFEARAERLRAWRREIAVGGEEGAALIHAENGKPLDDARVEVLGILEHVQYAVENAERVLGRREVPDSPTVPNQRAWVEYQPYGVVGVIGPWNFPLLTPGAILIEAIAAGNAAILKPSQITPGIGEWLVRAWQRAVPDFPDVLQCLNGFGATGQALIESGLNKLAFTGSVNTGKTVAAQCAQTLTPVLLELGGKDGVIVAEDADLDEAAKHIVWGAIQNTGHGCISLEVAYVVESVHDAFVEKISDLAKQVRVGSDDAAEIGPVPLPTQIPIIREHIQDALDRGATATVGGLDAVGERYVTPTILVGVSPDALAVTEETFGPTLAVVKVADTEEAIAHVNGGRVRTGQRRLQPRPRRGHRPPAPRRNDQHQRRPGLLHQPRGALRRPRRQRLRAQAGRGRTTGVRLPALLHRQDRPRPVLGHHLRQARGRDGRSPRRRAQQDPGRERREDRLTD